MVEMAANGTSVVKVERNLHGFTTLLTSAACEWFLIFLLLLDAVLSYLLTKFASYCDLQLPCILCSRLDHALGNEKPEFYRNLFCSNHRSEISTLICCHIHGRLVDGRVTCEDCLLSFTSKTKSNPDMHRLFLGKLGFDVGGSGLQSSFLNRDFSPVPMGMRSCSCCNKPWRSRTNSQRLFQPPPPGSAGTKPNIPLPRRLGRRDSLKKMRDKFSGPATSRRLGKSGFDPLSHVGYTKLQITSDSESEFPFSDDDDDDGSSVVRDINESVVQRASEVPPKALPNDVAPAKLMHHSFGTGPSLANQCIKPDVSKPQDVKSLTSDIATGHDLGELNWHQADQKTFPYALPELISLDDIPPLSNAVETPIGVLPQNSNASALSELICLVDTPPPFDVVKIPDGGSSDMYITGTSDIRDVRKIKHEEILKSVSTTAEAGIQTDQVVNDPAPIDPTYGDPCDVSNSAKEKEAFGFVAEQPTVKERDGVNEDSKLLLAQNTLAQGIHTSLSNTSLRGHGDGLQITGSGLIERTGSAGIESLDGSSVSEIEGESIVDRLKRQVEYDRRCMSDLCKELEEERSASAVATNQAMAMITRLQEEKAALHMEALQYLRMMEEQAEYDVEALEKANDLLAEREKEIQDLETELEYCRLKLPDESMVETLPEKNFDFKEKNVAVEDTTASCIKDDANVSCKTKFSEVSEGSDKPVVVSSWSEFEAEKLYISRRLKGLERKLRQFTHDGTLSNMSDSGDSVEAADGGHNRREFSGDEYSQMGENGLPMQKDSPVSNGIHPDREGSNASIGEDQIVSKENNHMVANGQINSMQCREIDFVALENEVSDLNDRLESLEADCNFLEHSFHSLQSGNEGMQFLQEIAHQLQELRKIGIRSRCRSVS